MDTSGQWPQIVVKTIEEIVTDTYPKAATLEKKTTREPQKEQALKYCPRCNSTNTKFCYYNNYSLTQPRYFCKTCRRYWTDGGSLRNIPVGGSSRKNKRPSSSDSPSSSSKNPKIHEAQDLNLGFKANATQGYASHVSEFVQLPNNNQIPNSSSSSSSSPASQLSAMELLNGISSRGLNSVTSFIPMPVSDSSTVYTSTHEFKPILNFSLDGLGSGSLHEPTNGRVLFPFEDPKQVTNTTDDEQNKEQGDSAGYWSGILGGGSW